MSAATSGDGRHGSTPSRPALVRNREACGDPTQERLSPPYTALVAGTLGDITAVLGTRVRDDEDAIAYAEVLTSLPTAPFYEHAAHRAIQEFVRVRPRLRQWSDQSGNLLVAYGLDDRSRPLVVATAHLDHPGFEIMGRSSGDAVDLRFLGGIHPAAIPHGALVDLYAVGAAEPMGQAAIVTRTGDSELQSASATIVTGSAPATGFAVWALPETGTDRPDTIRGLACDALSVAAALLVTLDWLDQNGSPETRFWGLFTRAEELRCLGALEAIRLGTIPDGTPVVALDCTRPVNDVRLGAGVVVRVGDSRYTYDPLLTQEIISLASSGSAPWQRRFSNSGWCEASVFQAAGRHPATSLTLPILNYHNQVHHDGSDVGLIREAVHHTDYLALIEVLKVLAENPPKGASPPWLTTLIGEAASRFTRAPEIGSGGSGE